MFGLTDVLIGISRSNTKNIDQFRYQGEPIVIIPDRKKLWSANLSASPSVLSQTWWLLDSSCIRWGSFKVPRDYFKCNRSNTRRIRCHSNPVFSIQVSGLHYDHIIVKKQLTAEIIKMLSSTYWWSSSWYTETLQRRKVSGGPNGSKIEGFTTEIWWKDVEINGTKWKSSWHWL